MRVARTLVRAAYTLVRAARSRASTRPLEDTLPRCLTLLEGPTLPVSAWYYYSIHTMYMYSMLVVFDDDGTVVMLVSRVRVFRGLWPGYLEARGPGI